MGDIRFATIDKQDVIDEKCWQCFYGVYDKVKNFKTIKYYICKDYKAYPVFDLGTWLTIDEIKLVVKYLRKIGFKFKVNYKDKTWHIRNAKEELETITFTIDCENNSNISILILLNVFRYINESDFYKKLQLFLKLMKVKDSDVTPFSRLLLADTLMRVGNANHTMPWSARSLFKNLTAEDIKSTIIEDRRINLTSVNSNLMHVEREKKEKLLKEMQILLEQNKLKEILDLYEEQGN